MNKVPAEFPKNRLSLIRAMEFGIEKLNEEKKFPPEMISKVEAMVKVIRSNKNKQALCLEPDANYAISYSKDLTNPFEKNKRVLTTLARYVRRQLQIDVASLPDPVLDEFANKSIGHIRYKNEFAELKIIHGYDIRKFYANSTQIDSCMAGVHSPRVELYCLNPKYISLLTYKNEGRALLWHDDKGNKYMDRVYGNHKVVSLFAVWAEGNGYLQYNKGNIPELAFELKCNRYLPSIDSIFYLKFAEDKKTLKASNKNFAGSHQQQFNNITITGLQPIPCNKCRQYNAPEEEDHRLHDNKYVCDRCLTNMILCVDCHHEVEEINADKVCPECAANRVKKAEEEAKAASSVKETSSVKTIEEVLKDPKVCSNKLCGFKNSKNKMLKIKKVGAKRSCYVCSEKCAVLIDSNYTV